MSKTRDTMVEESSGNVFADLGIAKPEDALAKARLMHLIKAAIERDGLTQVEAAKRAGIAQSDVSNIVRGRGRTYSMERLFDIIHALGGNITIQAEIGKSKERIAVYA